MPLLRWLVFSIFRLFYRPEVRGLENVPRHGAALIVSNHQSFLDAMLITSVLPRPVPFLISASVMRVWWVLPFAKVTRAIPVERTNGPRALGAALERARAELARGGLVALFPEGMISRTGTLLPFQRGYEKIVEGTDVPLVPVAVDGGAETRWGRLEGAGGSVRPPRRGWRVPLRIAFGKPLPPTTPPAELRQVIAEQLVVAFSLRRRDEEPLHRAAIRRMRRRPLARLLADHATHEPLPNLKVLAGLVALGDKLRTRIGDDPVVGVMLPPTLGGVLTNVFLAAAGRIAVNLNYTASTRILDEIRQDTGMRLVITSRVFLEKAPVALPEELDIVCLEDLRDEITGMDRLVGLAVGLLAPMTVLERRLGRTRAPHVEDVVGLLYSSGSTGTPKGIPLTHWNIVSNIRGSLLAVRLPDHAHLLGALPFFHSFGYMVALWLPMLGGIRISYFPNPLDARGVAESVRRSGVTHLFATPTFLAQYVRRVEPEEFASLEFVLTGAEKLRDSVADAFEKQFGVRPIEGYGCTETSPVVALSAPDVRGAGLLQRGHKPGSVGVPIPGVAVRTVDPESLAPLPVGAPGLLLVSGPNVMAGYHKRPELTAEAFLDGWYRTGDIAHVDDEGFLFITDRLSRFSKIAGEMVPHGRIEEALQAAAGEAEPCFAVTGIPDERRGERLIVLTTLPADRVRAALDALAQPGFDLPALWIPRERDVVAVEAIPVLGSGKKDLQRIRQVALESTT
jgi:acyl-[acyl-carrier-protein]-phospholipid O-acyltransferase/long-chain-fatty-acid--[acyl-carrier-protein] ligase